MAAAIGNRNSADGKAITAAVKRAMLREARNGKQRLEVMAENIGQAVENSERWAIELVWDRWEGKALQQLEVNADGPLAINIIRFTDGQTGADMATRAPSKVIEHESVNQAQLIDKYDV